MITLNISQFKDYTYYPIYNMFDADGCIIDSETAICMCWLDLLLNIKSSLSLQAEEAVEEILTFSNFKNPKNIISLLKINNFFVSSEENQEKFDSEEAIKIFYNNVLRGSNEKNRQILMDRLYTTGIIKEAINVSKFESSKEFLDFVKKSGKIDVVVNTFHKSLQTPNACTFIATGAPYERAKMTLHQLRTPELEFVFFDESNNIHVYEDSKVRDDYTFNKDIKVVYVFAKLSKSNFENWQKGINRFQEVYPNFYNVNTCKNIKYRLFEDSVPNLVQFNNIFSKLVDESIKMTENIDELLEEKQRIMKATSQIDNIAFDSKEIELKKRIDSQIDNIYFNSETKELKQISLNENGAITERYDIDF